MKTRMGIAGLLLTMMLGISFAAKAQTIAYTLTNNLHCTVDVFYELRKANCAGATSGSITLAAGASTVVTINTNNIIGGCLIIQQINGVLAPSNHVWITTNPLFAPCHNLIPYGQSGTTATCGAYSVTITPTSWTIN